MKQPELLLLSAEDDVAIVREDVSCGQSLRVEGFELTAQQDIMAGHKVAIRRKHKGELIRKYGQVIGQAISSIQPGEHVHVHNLAMPDNLIEQIYDNGFPATIFNSEPLTFDGYMRNNGSVGTRNYIGVIASVNCSATVCKQIAQVFSDQRLKDFENVDGVVAITHGSGCGMASKGEGIEILKRTLQGYAAHPNFAGIVLIGLGCEVNQLSGLLIEPNKYSDDLISSLIIQELGGTRETVARGIEAIEKMLPIINAFKRTAVRLAHLTVGLQCGGSDGYSGITANPALGVAVDLLVKNGGTAILSETPEIYGAEHLLIARASTAAIAEKLISRIRWWENYVQLNGDEINNNPSPGNKAGGITTILEKSLGAVAKSGSTSLNAVYRYAEKVDTHGLVFMDTPGYDPVSATGQVAGGANLICFTTGRGSIYGCKPTPSLKIATNTKMYCRMEMDMDFNAGDIIEGLDSVAEAGRRLFALMLDTASGRRTCSEANGLGDNEFLPWQIGAVM